MYKICDLLENLCGRPGVPGCEISIGEFLLDLLSRYGKAKRDVLGNIICEVGVRKPSGALHVLLDAHLDQVGMVVTGHEMGGFLRVAPCGSLDLRALAAQRVLIHAPDGVLPGVILSSPPHLSNGETKRVTWGDMILDVGGLSQDLSRMIPLGTRVTLDVSPERLLGDRFMSPALDDRSGIAAILLALELLSSDQSLAYTVVFSVQEEVGGGGARAASFGVAPDIALVVDVSFAKTSDTPLEAQGILGGGVMIGIAPSLDEKLGQSLNQIAEKSGISHQFEVMNGRTGTNVEAIQLAGQGCRCALLSIPLRNMHSGVELVDLTDIDMTARLIAQYLRELPEERDLP